MINLRLNYFFPFCDNRLELRCSFVLNNIFLSRQIFCGFVFS